MMSINAYSINSDLLHTRVTIHSRYIRSEGVKYDVTVGVPSQTEQS